MRGYERRGREFESFMALHWNNDLAAIEIFRYYLFSRLKNFWWQFQRLHMSDIVQFITAIPKAELHVHIEGTIEADLLLTIADRNGIALPYKSAADILAGQNKGKSDPK